MFVTGNLQQKMRLCFVAAILMVFVVLTESRSFRHKRASNGWEVRSPETGHPHQSGNQWQNNGVNIEYLYELYGRQQENRQTENGILRRWNRRQNLDSGNTGLLNRRQWRKLQKKRARQQFRGQQSIALGAETVDGTSAMASRLSQSSRRQNKLTRQNIEQPIMENENKNQRRERKGEFLNNKFIRPRFKGFRLKDFQRASWKVEIPKDSTKSTKVREVAYVSREKNLVSIISSSRLRKTGFSPSTSLRDYNANQMAIKTFTSGGLACFVGNVDGTITPVIEVIERRNSSKHSVTLGKEKIFKAEVFNGDLRLVSEELAAFCSTRYGEVELYRLSDLVDKDLDVKLSFPVYGKEAVMSDHPTHKKLKVIDLFNTLVIHLKK